MNAVTLREVKIRGLVGLSGEREKGFVKGVKFIPVGASVASDESSIGIFWSSWRLMSSSSSIISCLSAVN